MYIHPKGLLPLLEIFSGQNLHLGELVHLIDINPDHFQNPSVC